MDILRDVRSLSMDGSSMRKAFHGGRSENWAEFLKASVKVRECHTEVEQEDEGRRIIAQHILQKKKELFLEADHRAS